MGEVSLTLLVNFFKILKSQIWNVGNWVSKNKKNALTFYWGTFESSNYMESKEGVGLYLVRYSKFFEFEIFLTDFCQTNISDPIFKNRITYICLAKICKKNFKFKKFWISHQIESNPLFRFHVIRALKSAPVKS